MKKAAKILALALAAVMVISVFAACGGSGDGGKKDILAGTWSQKDETNGNWSWTFDGKGNCQFKGDYYSGEGTYALDEAAGTVTVTKVWDEEKVFNYTLNGTTLELKNAYQTFNLTKEA